MGVEDGSEHAAGEETAPAPAPESSGESAVVEETEARDAKEAPVAHVPHVAAEEELGEADLPCCICGSNIYTKRNELLICKGSMCKIVVHQGTASTRTLLLWLSHSPFTIPHPPPFTSKTVTAPTTGRPDAIGTASAASPLAPSEHRKLYVAPRKEAKTRRFCAAAHSFSVSLSPPTCPPLLLLPSSYSSSSSSRPTRNALSARERMVPSSQRRPRRAGAT